MIGIMNEFEWMVDVGNRVYVTKPSQLFVGARISITTQHEFDIKDQLGIIVSFFDDSHYLVRFDDVFYRGLHDGDESDYGFDETKSKRSWYFMKDLVNNYDKVHLIT